MEPDLIANFESQRTDLFARWKDLLALDRTASPLASPEILVYMIDQTIEELLLALRRGRAAGQRRPEPVACECGRNPYLPYFGAGRQAIREALVLAQAAIPFLGAATRDAALAELDCAYREIERRHIEPFCAICQFSARPVRAQHATAP